MADKQFWLTTEKTFVIIESKSFTSELIGITGLIFNLSLTRHYVVATISSIIDNFSYLNTLLSCNFSPIAPTLSKRRCFSLIELLSDLLLHKMKCFLVLFFLWSNIAVLFCRNEIFGCYVLKKNWLLPILHLTCIRPFCQGKLRTVNFCWLWYFLFNFQRIQLLSKFLLVQPYWKIIFSHFLVLPTHFFVAFLTLAVHMPFISMKLSMKIPWFDMWKEYGSTYEKTRDGV